MNDAARFRSKSAIYSWKNHMGIENVADLFVATLEQAGVKRVYRIVGDSPNGITELRRNVRTWPATRRQAASQPRRLSCDG
jgi:hypothetical protein